MLALKSLVRANQVATQEFRDLLDFTSSSSGSTGPLDGPIAKYGLSDWANTSSYGVSAI